MEISLDDIKKESTPYQKFLESIKNPHTLRKYKNALNQFLSILPSKIYDEMLGVSSSNRMPQTLAAHFVDLDLPLKTGLTQEKRFRK